MFRISLYLPPLPLFVLVTFFLSITVCHVETADAADHQKNSEKSSDQSRETFTINGTKYEIPPPWCGNRLKDPHLDVSSLAQIPVKYTKDQTKLYIRKETLPHLVALLEKAEADGLLIQVQSAYRSAAYQKKIFERMMAKGRTFDDIVRYVAPPGYSEHMLGNAVDFYPSNWRFAETPQHAWLLKNANDFGFFNTYPQYNTLHMPWEAWHWNCTATAPR